MIKMKKACLFFVVSLFALSFLPNAIFAESLPPPGKLVAQSGPLATELKWLPSADSNVEGYNVHRRAVADAAFAFPPTPINAGLVKDTFYIDSDSTLVPGNTYEYAVKAVNYDGKKSDYSNTASAYFGKGLFFIPQVYGEPGATIMVPVSVKNADNLRITSANISIVYDPAVLTLVDLDPSTSKMDSVKRTVLTREYGWSVNTTGANYVVIAMVGNISNPPAIVGEGNFVELYFTVNPGITKGAASGVKFDVDGSITGKATKMWNENFALIDLQLDDGDFSAGSDYILGDVTGDQNVRADDGSYALAFSSNKSLSPTYKQLAAGDINGDEAIGNMDASAILYYVVNQDWPDLDSLTEISTEKRVFSFAKQGGSYKKNKAFFLAMNLNNPEGMASCEIMLTYDPKILEIKSFQPGSMLKNFEVKYPSKQSKGVFQFALASKDGSAASNSNLEAFGKLKILAKKPGSSRINFSLARMGDAFARDFERSDLNIEVEGLAETMTVTK